MSRLFLFILATIAFMALWPVAKKYPKMLVRDIAWFKDTYSDFNLQYFNRPQVFSAETAEGKEAEFIDDKLSEERKIVRLLRAMLIGLYLFATAYLYLKR